MDNTGTTGNYSVKLSDLKAETRDRYAAMVHGFSWENFHEGEQYYSLAAAIWLKLEWILDDPEGNLLDEDGNIDMGSEGIAAIMEARQYIDIMRVDDRVLD